MFQNIFKRSPKPAPLPLFDETFVRRLEKLSFRTAPTLRGTMPGERRSRNLRPALDFSDHRPYAHGDDLRHVDWNAYSRHEELFVKLGEATQSVTVHILLDRSRSMANANLARTKLYAPFSGILSEVQIQEGQQVNAGTPLATLMAPSSYRVRLQVLEQDAVALKTGQPVIILPVALPDVALTGRIRTILPAVNKEGLVDVLADFIQRHDKLLSGMKVQVRIEQRLPDQLIIPKEALVLRSGKQVVFTYDEASGLAKWNYVEVAHENDRWLAIRDGLKPGDQVIISNNANLAHDAEVDVRY